MQNKDRTKAVAELGSRDRTPAGEPRDWLRHPEPVNKPRTWLDQLIEEIESGMLWQEPAPVDNPQEKGIG